jgi:hypothetical protein
VRTTTTPTRAGLDSAWLLAGLLAGAGIIHVSVILGHRADDTTLAIGFALVAWFQLATAYLVVRQPASRPLLAAIVVGNLGVLGAWALSRTSGLPFDLHGGVAEPAALLDVVASAFAAGAVVLALAGLLAEWHLRGPVSVAGAGALLGLATMALVAPPATSTTTTVSASGAATGGHDHGHSHGGGDGHAAGADDVGGHAAEMLAIDRARCDLGVNPQAYWEEALAMGIDTYAGGAMDATHGQSTLAEVAGPLPLAGRGSEHLDRLISLASQADGEAAAATFIAELTKATDAEYEAWRLWYRSTMAGQGHAHDAAAPSDSPTPHMGHVEPQPWKAMVDPVACDRLAEELESARGVAERYPTAADATEAGWIRVTPYLPGIAAHYMNFSLVDGTFEIDKPEMLLYDGTAPESRIVGLSYYIQLPGSVQPTQGFTGDNDHYHRHIGLCVGAGGVIGDSTTTDEECAARGGVKAAGTAGWMSHAWVVPGCESPWGVFSAVNPVLDVALNEASGQQEGCAGSEARLRYDLSPGHSGLRSAPTEELAGG